MRKIIILLIFILLIFAAFLLSFKYNLRPAPGLKTLYINDSKILVELADTDQKRALGLSGKDSLPENQGMLFIFSQPDYYSFWMKDMRFALDFIWINAHNVVQINQNIKPVDFQPPESLRSNQPVDAVLEINAGMAQKLNIKIGDKVKY